MLAKVRNRRGIIVSVDPFDAKPDGRLHLVRVEYTDFDGVGEDTFLWEREPAATLLEPTALPRVSEDPPMPAADLEALLRASRWSALSPFLNIDGSSATRTHPVIASPLHGAVQVEDFQLIPLLKALQMPRVSLLLADDVGLGKTVEAGLILTELLLRRRIRRVLILCPASLRYQWQQEMKDKFALSFDVVDRPETHAMQKRLGLDANPWRVFTRIVASYHYLRQPDVLEQFRAACRQPEGFAQLPWDLLIVDEAHNLMPSNFGEDSDLSSMLRSISPWFEHKLFLTATPHNGHTRCFSGLLEQLDPVRFTQTSEFQAAERVRIEEVVVRRLKKEINEVDRTAGLVARFCERYLEPLPLFIGKAEGSLSHAFEEFRKALRSLIASSRRTDQIAGSFAIEVLNKRLLSCPATFADSWYRLKDGLIDATAAEAQEMRAAYRESEEDMDDDREKASRSRHAARTAGAWLKPLAESLSSEIEAVDRSLAQLGLISNGTAITDPIEDERLQRLFDLVRKRLRDGDRWIADERLIVFTEYKTTLDYVTRRLQREFKDNGSAIRVLYGQMDRGDFEQVKSAFNDPADALRILVATDAASEGQNLQNTARLILHYEIPWNPSRLEQRNGRLDRHGQARDVTVFHFTSDNDADLRFLGYVVNKVHAIRDDLGSMGEVFDAAFQRRFVDLEDSGRLEAEVDSAIDKKRGRAHVPRAKTVAIGREEAEHLAEFYNDIDLSPETLRQTLSVAMGVGAGQSSLDGPDAKGRFRLHLPIPPAWEPLIDDALRITTQGGNRGALPALVFDPQYFVSTVSGRPVFRATNDTVLLHLGHPLFRQALATFARARFPGGHEFARVSRWIVRRAPTPKEVDALLVLSVEELGVNALREPFHHWIRTLRFSITDGKIGKPLEYVAPGKDVVATDTIAGADVEVARSIWDDISLEASSLLEGMSVELTTRMRDKLKEAGRQALTEEKDRFKHRLAEVERAMRENTLQRLEKERDTLLAELRQGMLFPDLVRAKQEELENLDQELHRRRTHYEDLRRELEKEQDRVLKLLIPKRYELHGKVQVFPLTVEIRLPESQS